VGRAAVLGFALSRSRVLATLLWSSITFFSLSTTGPRIHWSRAPEKSRVSGRSAQGFIAGGIAVDKRICFTLCIGFEIRVCSFREWLHVQADT
jgi:hypothetical protein